MFISIGFIGSNILCFSPDMWLIIESNLAGWNSKLNTRGEKKRSEFRKMDI